VLCCRESLAFVAFDRSDDFPLEVKADKLNLDRPSGLVLDVDLSLLLVDGGGGKFIGAGGSLRVLPLNGDMTVTALAGLANSVACAGEVPGNEVCKADGLRLEVGRSRLCAILWPGGGEYGGGGDGKGTVNMMSIGLPLKGSEVGNILRELSPVLSLTPQTRSTNSKAVQIPQKRQ
jgi:hypothetical protein